ncbi:MAG TPA: CoA pyrophosphatase [Bacteroidota bacterium]|nr:CoA pyrophosphatase [Bacteroidota bacterium]
MRERIASGLDRLDAERKRTIVEMEGFRRAGVLVALIPTDDGADLLLTKRTDHVETHKGQIALPGGMVDDADENIVATALRETHEELGIPRSRIQVKGLLDDLPVPPHFIVTPVVGLLASLPPLAVNSAEVAEVFTVPLAFFCDPANGSTQEREFRGQKRQVWFFQHGEHLIWGATALVVRSLLERIGLLKV